MKKALLVLMLIAAVAFNTKSFASITSAIVGSWKVEAPDAPWEYAKSTLVVTETNKVLTAKLVFEDKQEVKVNSIEFAKDILKFSIMIEGNDILVTGKLADSKLAGSADTPDGEMKFTAVKVK
jgi:hypothetical protein